MYLAYPSIPLHPQLGPSSPCFLDLKYLFTFFIYFMNVYIAAATGGTIRSTAAAQPTRIAMSSSSGITSGSGLSSSGGQPIKIVGSGGQTFRFVDVIYKLKEALIIIFKKYSLFAILSLSKTGSSCGILSRSCSFAKFFYRL